MPMRRNRVPSSSRSSSARPVRKIRSARCVGSSRRRLRVRVLKSRVFSFSTTVWPARPCAFSRAATFSESLRRIGTRSSALARSVLKVVSAETLLASRSGDIRRGVDAARQPIEALAHRPVASHEVAFLHRLELADRADAVAFQRGGESLADAPDERHRLAGQEGHGFRLADDREAARLVEVGGHLGEERAVGETDGNGDADFAFDAAGEFRQGAGRGIAVQSLGAGQIEKGLVDRHRLDERREFLHQRAHLLADARVFLHVGLDDDRLRAGFQRLEHRHCRAHAADAGDVAGSGDDAAPAAADDHGLVAQLRIVALFHRSVEGVAVDVGDREIMQFRVAHDTRAAAAAASALGARLRLETVATKARSGLEVGRHHRNKN